MRWFVRLTLPIIVTIGWITTAGAQESADPPEKAASRRHVIRVGGYVGDPAIDSPYRGWTNAEDSTTADDPEAIRPWLVQFERPLLTDERVWLGESESAHYVGENTYLLYSPQSRTAIKGRRVGGVRELTIRSVQPYTSPELKAHADLTSQFKRMENETPAQAKRRKRRRRQHERYRAVLHGPLLPATRPFATIEQGLGEDLEASGLTIREYSATDYRDSGGSAFIRFKGNIAAAEIVASQPDVLWIEHAGELIQDSSPRSVCPTGSTAPQIQVHGTIQGKDQLVNVIDQDPVDVQHCWFKDLYNSTINPSHRKVVGKWPPNVVFGPGFDHPTFTAGIVAGSAPPGHSEVAAGQAPDAKLFITQLPDYDDLPKALSDIVGMATQPRVHVASWHVVGRRGKPKYDDTCKAVDSFTWRHPEQLVVGSAGSGSSMGAPGTAKNALCVAACDPQKTRVLIGARGPTRDGRRKPDIVATGCCVKSASAKSDCDISSGKKVMRRHCGSSFAAPRVAAAAALVRQYYLDGHHPDGKHDPSGALLKATLLHGTSNISAHGNRPGPVQGWGVLSLPDVLFFSNATRRMAYFDIPRSVGIKPSERLTVSLPVGQGPLKATLVWTDPPAVNHAVPLMNDLDIAVDAPTSSCITSQDRVNNVEQVSCTVRKEVTAKISVVGRDVSMPVRTPAQGLALVITYSTPKRPSKPSVDRSFDPTSHSSLDSPPSSAADQQRLRASSFGHRRTPTLPPANAAEPTGSQPRSDRWQFAIRDQEHDDHGGIGDPDYRRAMDHRFGPHAFIGNNALPARIRTDSSRGTKTRHWLEVDVLGGLGHISKATASSPIGDGAFVGSAAADYRFTILKQPQANDRFHRAHEYGAGMKWTQRDWEDDRNSSWRLREAWASYERDIWSRAADGTGLPLDRRSSWGVRLDHATEALSGADDIRSFQLAAAGSINWSKHATCELNRSVFHAAYSQLDDQVSPSGALDDRNGDRLVVGYRHNLIPYPASMDPTDRDWRCEGRSVFRDPYLDDFVSLLVGYEHRWEWSSGALQDRRVHRFTHRGQAPLDERSAEPNNDESPSFRRVPTVDWSARIDLVSHGAQVAADRENTVGRVSLGFTFPLKSVNSLPRRYFDATIRVGASRTWNDPRLPLWANDRTIITITARGVLGLRTGRNWKFDIPSEGSLGDPGSGSGFER